MENIINRHRNLSILAMVLFAQILGLAVQVKKGTDRGTSSLIRVWAVSAITPIEKAAVHTSRWFSNTWHSYLYLRSVREQNQQLRQEIERMRLEQVRLAQDAGQARRLQTLLGFKEQFISQTVAAQVISTTGSEFSRGIYIDKGSRDGIKPDMPVVTPDGIVGKVFRVYPNSSLVLEINDASSGAGVILEKSRLQGILKGSPSGGAFVANVTADEKVEIGERILTSGGDRVYPKGIAVGTVSRVSPAGTFLNVEVKPAAQLNHLEEVLVITKIVEKTPEVIDPNAPVRAIDILAQRLPSVPPPKPEAPKPAAKPQTAASAAKPNPPATAPATKPATDTTIKAAAPTGKPGAEAAAKAVVGAAEGNGQLPKPAKVISPADTAAQTPSSPTPKKDAAGVDEKNAATVKPAAEVAKPDNSTKDTPR